jgi:hypothetical protein
MTTPSSVITSISCGCGLQFTDQRLWRGDTVVEGCPGPTASPA